MQKPGRNQKMSEERTIKGWLEKSRRNGAEYMLIIKDQYDFEERRIEV
jgi:hypothetical protein